MHGAESAAEIERLRQLHAALEERARLLAQERFLSFIRYMEPTFVVSRHHQIIAEHLEAVERGDIRDLIVCMPPRSSKSWMISLFYPPWYLGRHPTRQVLSVSYAADLATGWGKGVRDMISSPEYRLIFPDCQVSRTSRAAFHWTTTQGGVYNAAGITGGVAGKGAHLGLIDDPLNEQDAYSKSAREHVKRWWPGGFYSRVMPNGSRIILSTRWNEDDLVGYILSESGADATQSQWTVLSIPAILDEAGSRLLGYPQGTSYWPVNEEAAKDDRVGLAGWPLEELKLRKAALPQYQWDALYQQRPTAIEGSIIKDEWWKTWPKPDFPSCEYKVLSIDTAFSEEETADFSAAILWGVFSSAEEKEDAAKAEHNFIALDAERGRWAFPVLREKILALCEKHRPDIVLIEKKASGQSLIQELAKTLLPVFAYQPDKNKVVRAHTCTPTFAQGRVYLPDQTLYPWAADIREECTRFSAKGSAHDDYVDCTTQAILWVRSNLMLRLDTEPTWWGKDDDAPRRRRRAY